MSSRIEVFEQMIANDPDNTMVLFGLANEYLKEGNLKKGIETLETYISKGTDEGAAYGMLSKAYEDSGDVPKALEILEQGIDASLANGHPSMAAEFRERLDEF